MGVGPGHETELNLETGTSDKGSNRELTDHDGVVSGCYNFRRPHNNELVLLVVEDLLQAHLDPMRPGPSEQIRFLDFQIL